MPQSAAARMKLMKGDSFFKRVKRSWDTLRKTPFKPMNDKDITKGPQY